MHQDVLLNCVQDAHHQVGVVSAVAPLPASRSRRCSHFLYRFLCIFFIFDSHKRVWALILQSLPCHQRSLPFFPSSLPQGCRRPPVLTSMLVLSYTTPLVCYFAAALHASSFDLLCYSFNKCAFCFCCCCGVLFFDLIFRVISCVMYIFLFWRRLFLLCQRFLDIFPRARTLQHWCSLLFFLLFNIQSSHVFLFFLLSWVFFSSRK